MLKKTSKFYIESKYKKEYNLSLKVIYNLISTDFNPLGPLGRVGDRVALSCIKGTFYLNKLINKRLWQTILSFISNLYDSILTGNWIIFKQINII